jgi:homoserine/homoserine lactone efflux protein
MTLQSWLLFCLTEIVLCISPGPAVLFVVSTALRRGFRPGTLAATGILAGNTFYFMLSATGIATLLLASHRLFAILKWGGAAYLLWLGLRMLMARVPAPEASADQGAQGRQLTFLRAFITQAANPKALVFFIALLPQFINPGDSVPRQILILGLSSVAIEFSVLSAYAAMAARARALTTRRFAGSLERIGGSCLIIAGARLAWSRHD